MKRNTLFGAAALLMAGAAIGGGAVITQNAMADDGASSALDTVDTVMMVNIGADGTGVQCTFTGADAQGLLPIPIPVDGAGEAIVGVAEVGTVDISGAVGDLPAIEVSTVDPDSLPVGTVMGEATVSGVVAAGDDDVYATGDVRDGTADECAAMREQALADLADLKAQVEAGGSITVSAATEP